MSDLQRRVKRLEDDATEAMLQRIEQMSDVDLEMLYLTIPEHERRRLATMTDEQLREMVQTGKWPV